MSSSQSAIGHKGTQFLHLQLLRFQRSHTLSYKKTLGFHNYLSGAQN